MSDQSITVDLSLYVNAIVKADDEGLALRAVRNAVAKLMANGSLGEAIAQHLPDGVELEETVGDFFEQPKIVPQDEDEDDGAGSAVQIELISGGNVIPLARKAG